MRIYPDLTQDEEFKTLRALSYTGSLNDMQYAYLSSFGFSGSLNDMFKHFNALSSPIVVPANAIAAWDIWDTSTLYSDTSRTTLIDGNDGDLVRGIADVSGNSVHLTSAGGAPPTFNTDGEHRWLTFNGSTMWLTAAMPLSGVTSVNLYADCEDAGTVTGGGWIYNHDGVSGRALILEIPDDTAYDASMTVRDDSLVVQKTTTTVGDGRHTFEGRVDLSAGTIDFLVDGVSAQTNNSVDTDTTLADSAFYVGRRSDNASNYYAGKWFGGYVEDTS